MAQGGFGRTKRRIQESKRQKREEKRLKRLNKGAEPTTPALPIELSETPLTPDSLEASA